MNDGRTNEFFINLYIISQSTKLGLCMLLFIIMPVKNKALGTGRKSMKAGATKGSSNDPVPRGEAKEESPLIDLPGNPSLCVIIKYKFRESQEQQKRKRKSPGAGASPGALKSRIVR